MCPCAPAGGVGRWVMPHVWRWRADPRSTQPNTDFDPCSIGNQAHFRPTAPHKTTNQQVQHFHYEEETSPIFQLETFGFRTGVWLIVCVSGDGWLGGRVDRSVLDGGMQVSALLDDKASITP